MVKLSELMEQGAKELKPHREEYFDYDVNPTAACALGCAMYAAKVGLPSELAPFVGYAFIDTDIPVASLPDDIRDSFATDEGFVGLKTVITFTNDYISRARAIELTKELGY